VEDIALNQLLMKTLLDDFGFERDIAANGMIAIEKLKTKQYDVILMDLQMPEMNGFEATDHIRNVMCSDIPIIALTADVTTADVARCKAVGMNDYISKPVDERLLYRKIVSLTSLPRLVRMAEKADVMALDGHERHTDLSYLSIRTKADPVLMKEMIDAYLLQTPPLVASMQQGLMNKDWTLLRASVHKMIPSFSIMGINTSVELMARKVQDYASANEKLDGIEDLVKQLAYVCTEACRELNEELIKMKTA